MGLIGKPAAMILRLEVHGPLNTETAKHCQVDRLNLGPASLALGIDD
jgi:hypothetical protein